MDEFFETIVGGIGAFILWMLLGIFLVAILHYWLIPFVIPAYATWGISYWQAYVGYFIVKIVT